MCLSTKNLARKPDSPCKIFHNALFEYLANIQSDLKFVKNAVTLLAAFSFVLGLIIGLILGGK